MQKSCCPRAAALLLCVFFFDMKIVRGKVPFRGKIDNKESAFP